MTARNLKIYMVSTADGEIQTLEHNGVMKTLGDKHLIQYTDEGGVRTSIKLDEDSVHIIRSGADLDHRLTVKSGVKTVGVMGDSSFTVLGRRSEWHCDDMNGEIRINYTLPDISEKAMDFNIRIKFSFCD